MNLQEFHDRYDTGLYFEDGTWFRRSVTDLSGRCKPLVAEMLATSRPVPWYTEQHRNDALAALPSAEPDTAMRDQLHTHIAGSPVAARLPGSYLEIVGIGAGAYFFRGRAVWPEPATNPFFWSRTMRAFWNRYLEGEPQIPFENHGARDAWIVLSPHIEPEATEETSPLGLDIQAIMQAVRLHPCLP